MPCVPKALAASMLLVPAAHAQLTQTLPPGLEQLEGASADSALFLFTLQQHWHWIYGASNFPPSGPIEITQIDLRPDATANSWPTAFFGDLQLEIGQPFVSSSSAAYPSNLGAFWDDASPRTCRTGPLILPIGSASRSPRDWVLSFPVSFVIDPRDERELVLAWRVPGPLSNPWMTIDAAATSRYQGAMMGAFFSSNATMASVIDRARVPVVRMHYRPLGAIHAAFRGAAWALPGTITPGQSILLQDLSSTPDPQGIRSWEWDFESDGVVDSRVRNPTFLASACGEFDVTLRVADASGARATAVRRKFVRVATPQPLVARFAYAEQRTSATCPITYAYTDQTTGGPTSWAWDFESDGIVDSTLQNPRQIVNATGRRRVRLQVGNGCETSIAEQVIDSWCNAADDCSRAIYLQGSPPYRNLSNVEATRSPQIAVCSPPNADVWYTFVPDGTWSMSYAACPTSGPSGFAPEVQVYVGACNNLVRIACVPSSCAVPVDPQFVTYGQQRVYLRVSEPRGLQGTFDLLAGPSLSSAGYITRPFPGCGGARLDVQGRPQRGQTLNFQIASNGSPTAIWLGLGIAPMWVCDAPCFLTSYAHILVSAPSTSFPIPNGTYVSGTRFFAQGAIAGGSGGCGVGTALPFATTDTLQIDVW
jgi:hypothetical protein